jgi:maleate isomerase
MARSVRLGFLVPPGNPTVEPEMIEMAPKSVSVHFSRMVAYGPTGTLEGQEARNRTQIEHIGESAGLLAMVKPGVIMLAHTATSYTLGRQAEAQLVQRLRDQCGTAVATAFGSVLDALKVACCARHALQRGDHPQRQGAVRGAWFGSCQPRPAQKRHEYLR